MSDDAPDPTELSRRELLKRMGILAGGTAIAGPLSGCEGILRRQPAIEVEEWHQSACRFCGTGCGIQIGTKDGEIVDVQGDPEAHNRGRLCIKGILNRDILDVEDRAEQPMIRHNGDLKQASWDEAMRLVAKEFRNSIDTHGPDSVGFYGSGQLFTQESYTANKLFKAGIGTNNVDGNPRLCMASAAVGYISTFGADEPMGCYEDVDHADCFFITGSNTHDCHPIIWERVMDRKRRHPDTDIIVVDPRTTATAEKADIHLPITPGTDVSLYNAMIYEFIENEYLDEEVVNEHVTFREGGNERSFEDLKQHVQSYRPEDVADRCGLSARRIREVAHTFADAEATMSIWTMGLNQQAQGTACNRLVNAMHLLTGHIGRPGATPFSLTGQPNAGGGVRDTGTLAHALPAGRLVAKDEDRAEMEDLWGVPEGTISPEPGYHAVAMFEALRTGDLKCCLVMGTNPGQSLPNAERYHEGMDRGFLAVADSIHPTETTKRADVVLPSAMWAEKGGVFSQSERRYHIVPKVVDPPGAARPDLDILVDLADRLGHGDLISARTREDVWNEWRKISEGSYYDFRGITYERLREQPGLLWPCPDEDHPGTCRRFVPGEDPLSEQDEGRLDFYKAENGRAKVWLHDQKEPSDPYSDEYPLTLTTGRVLEHWHTATITGGLDQLQDIDIDFLEVHPQDARKRGISDGDPVRVVSRRGDATMRARVTDEIALGTVFATFHSAQRLINATVNDTVDPFSKEPEFKVSAVDIEPNPDRANA